MVKENQIRAMPPKHSRMATRQIPRKEMANRNQRRTLNALRVGRTTTQAIALTGRS